MIINSLARIINDFVDLLYNSGIHFYQIILGLFIFNVLVYFLTGFIRSIDR